MDLLNGLNERQRLAVTHTEGPLLIFAGAGSGKTRTLTHRIAYLVQEKHVYASRILAVTFTNKAAREMGERLEKLMGPETKRMWLGTFHSLCARMLRIHGERIGLDPRFTIMDADDQLRLVREILRDAGVDTERFPPARVLGKISDAKNQLLSPEEVASTATRPHEKIYSSVYTKYQQRLRAASALDFDDLLSESVRLLNENPESLEYWSDRFQHVLIDEFQDVNEAQFQWARLLASKHRNICVVGDDDQSIYAWRGADVRIILEFEQRYPDAQVVRLEQNYRSTQTILDAAHGVISNNIGRASKRLWTENEGDAKLVLHGAYNAQEEALWVVRQIQSLEREEHRSYQDFAILCRMNAQSRPFEEAFMRARIPLKLIGTQRFYERKEIRDLLAYLRFIYNPNDVTATTRLINTPPRGIGAVTVDKLQQIADGGGRSLGSVILDLQAMRDLSPGVLRRIDPLRRLLLQLLKDASEVETLGDLVERVIERTHYKDYLYAERDGDSVDREANVDEFLRAAEAFDLRVAEELDEAGETTEVWTEDDRLRLGQFLSETALESSGDRAAGQGANAAESVTLMTLHSAKGLEFPVVFLAGLEQGLLPHARALQDQSVSASQKDLEEERRLMYVGLTRARELAFLSFAAQRTLHGRTESTRPSQFIDEIPAHLMKREGVAAGGSRIVQSRATSWDRGFSDLQRPPAAAPSFSVGKPPAKDLPPATFKIGDRVKHGSYGEGLVVGAATNGGPGEWVEVAFLSGGVGKKKLIVAYANLAKAG